MPHSGGRVGSGIYLASENGKSAGYCSFHGTTGVMFLCEAALGKQRIVDSDSWGSGHKDAATKMKDNLGSVGWNEKDPVSAGGYNSCLAIGKTEPDASDDLETEFDGHSVTVPQGTVKPNPDKGAKSSSFNQSEYLVYDESQVRIRYVLQMEFDY